jgi:hypothetical protein
MAEISRQQISLQELPGSSTDIDMQIVVPRGSRILGMDCANDAEAAPRHDAFYKARAAGAQAVSLSLNWDQIEPMPNVYVDPWNVISTANSFYPASYSMVSLTIRPIDANSKPVPPDLKNLAFGDPVMIDRFNRMLRWVLAQLNQVTFTSIQIGNEIDNYVGLDVVGYAEFVFWANVQIKALRPEIPVGYTATWEGLVYGPLKDALLWLKSYVDVVGVTYYPLGDNFQVRQPAVVPGDIDALMVNYLDKLVYLQEVGYPSGPLCNSSESLQNDFVRNVFAAWDRHARNIGYLSFVRVHDWSRAEANRVASGEPYHLPYPTFSEYLRTLGLRTYSNGGRDKPAMMTLAREVAARGWTVFGMV